MLRLTESTTLQCSLWQFCSEVVQTELCKWEHMQTRLTEANSPVMHSLTSQTPSFCLSLCPLLGSLPTPHPSDRSFIDVDESVSGGKYAWPLIYCCGLRSKKCVWRLRVCVRSHRNVVYSVRLKAEALWVCVRLSSNSLVILLSPWAPNDGCISACLNRHAQHITHIHTPTRASI